MRTFELNKLVRDNLVKMMQDLGQTVEHHVLDETRYARELGRKLVEETGEFDVAKADAAKELADIQEVVDALVAELGMTQEEFRHLQAERSEKRGGFTKRLYVETVTMADDDPWATYYAAEPNRFPEILKGETEGDLRQETIDTYNNSAQGLSDYFKGIGPRVQDIKSAFDLIKGVTNPKVLEIGCGDGRDAVEIRKRTNDYTGFDISSELIRLAKNHIPEAKFEIADACDYHYPKGVDIVFAFASLLHLNKDELKIVMGKVHSAMNQNGIFYISLKYSPNYREVIKEDVYGRRLFYLYNPESVTDIAGSDYSIAKVSRKMIGHTEWCEIALRRL